MEALACNRPYREIALWADPPVTTMALSRYKRSATAHISAVIAKANAAITNNDGHLTPSVMSAVTQAALLTASDPLLARISKHQATADAEIASASGDGRTVAALIGADLRGIELTARLTGRLDSGAAAVTVNLVCPAPAPVATESDDVVTIDITAG